LSVFMDTLLTLRDLSCQVIPQNLPRAMGYYFWQNVSLAFVDPKQLWAI
jgi:hypothetical protein